MNAKIWIVSSVAGATLIAGGLLAQNPPAPQPGNADITDLPPVRGVYYRAADGWEPLSFTLLMPIGAGGPMSFFSIGPSRTFVDMPGSHAGIQITDARPTFYLRGIPTVELYLVRATSKRGYREVRMPTNGRFREWAHFRDKDVTKVEIQGRSLDVASVNPVADLKPGEYALASVVEPGDPWIRLGFDFGLSSASGGK